MIVYVVERGAYEQRGIEGVYGSLQAAIAAHPCREPEPAVLARWDQWEANGRKGAAPLSRIERRGGWQEESDGKWSNGLDWEEGKEITAFEVL